MTRRILTLGVVLLLVTSTSVAPATAFLDGDDGPPTPTIQKYDVGGSLQPSYVVSFETGSYADLREWTNATGGELIAVDNDSTTATVAAPSGLVDAGFWARALSIRSVEDLSLLTDDALLTEQPWVESASPNYVLERPAPVTLANASEYTPPGRFGGVWQYDVPTAGMAFNEDANRTTMAESRRYLGADNVSASASGDNVTVAVVDTGANVASPAGRVFGNGTPGSDLRILNASKNMLTNETVARNGTDAIADGDGHGTWTAAAVAANANGTVHDGLAPNASLLIAKALNDDGKGSTATIAAAIRYAADEDADVISMSLGSPVYSEPIADAIAYAYDQGVSAVVVAAGNSRQTVRWVATPADVEGVIAVGATNGSEPATAGSAYFSQIGPDPGTTDTSGGVTQAAAVDVAAPGMRTVARAPTTGGYLQNATLSGTSMATPMVAGGIAAVLDANPGLRGDADAIRERVRDGARPIPNAATAEVGQGMFAADHAVAGTTPARDQSEAMADDASRRDDVYQALSDASGGWLPLAAVASRGQASS